MISVGARADLITSILTKFPKLSAFQVRRHEQDLYLRYSNNPALYIDRFQSLIFHKVHDKPLTDFFGLTIKPYCPPEVQTTIRKNKGFVNCKKCGSEAILDAKQTRRADEGMTIFCICPNPNCGKRWRL